MKMARILDPECVVSAGCAPQALPRPALEGRCFLHQIEPLALPGATAHVGWQRPARCRVESLARTLQGTGMDRQRSITTAHLGARMAAAAGLGLAALVSSAQPASAPSA